MTEISQLLESCASSVTEWRAHPGAAPLPRIDPASTAECAEILRLARTERRRVLPAGTGRRLASLATLPRADFVLGTRELRGVLDYESADGTLTARTGSSMAELATTVAAGGHHLGPAVARPAEGTLGGVVATAESGRDRLRNGPVRHMVLGAQVLLADGTGARSGGKLVKNVTGYDLHKLYCGSWGSLAFVTELSLRLFPAPERRAMLCARPRDRATALAAAGAVLALPLRPETVLLERDAEGAWGLFIVCAGRDVVVERELERVEAELQRSERIEDAARLDRVRDDDAPETLHLQLSALPGTADALAGAILQASEETEVHGSLRLHPGIATATFAPIEKSAERLAAFHRSLLANLDVQRTGTAWRWCGADAELSRLVALAGPAPAAGPRALMERLRNALDPDRLFAGAVPGIDTIAD